MWSERALPRPVVLVGGLIPDLVKIELGFDLLGIAVEDFIAPLHHTFFQRKEPVLRNTFSVSWQEYQLGVIHADNSWAALILLGVALLVYVLQNRNRPGLS